MKEPVLTGLGGCIIVRDKLEPADVIVVLGGDNSGERVAEAIAIYQQGYAPKMLMSGGPLAWQLTDAALMKKQAMASGISGRAIYTQERSRSTLEDAQFSLPILRSLKARSIILVTSPTHSRRARNVFAKYFKGSGIKIIIAPVKKSKFKLEGWWRRHEDTQLVIWEYVSLVYYFLKGYN